MDPGEAYELTEMLEGVVNYGTGKGIRDYGVRIAGKTGTTNDGMDVWFVGDTRGACGSATTCATDRGERERAAVSPRRRGRRSIKPVGENRAAETSPCRRG